MNRHSSLRDMYYCTYFLFAKVFQLCGVNLNTKSMLYIHFDVCEMKNWKSKETSMYCYRKPDHQSFWNKKYPFKNMCGSGWIHRRVQTNMQIYVYKFWVFYFHFGFCKTSEIVSKNAKICGWNATHFVFHFICWFT